jgi:hypothetical protein
VCKVETSQGNFIVKGQRAYKTHWRYWTIKFLALLISNPVLRPIPQLGGKHSQAIEARRLQELKASGVNVPAFRYETQNFIVMDQIEGVMLEPLFSGSSERATEAFELGLQAICDAHQKGQFLGQPFAKNMLVSGGKLFFVDFEEDPSQHMALAQCQARDLLLFIFSAVPLRQDLWAEWRAIWRRKLVGSSDLIRDFFAQEKKRKWIRNTVRIDQKLLGRDFYRIILAKNFLDF